MDADAEFRGVSGPAEPAFRSVLSRRQRRGVNWGVSAWIPPVDLYETDEASVLKAKLPGLTTDESQIEAHGRTLTLRETGVRPIRQENKLLMPAAFSPVR